MKGPVFVTILLLSGSLLLRSSIAEDFYVAISGSNTNDGSAAHPFATVFQARDAVRKLTADGLKTNVTVLIHRGVYELDEPFVLGPQDSGTKEFSINYDGVPGEMVVLSGGKRITGWQQGTGKIWTAQLPGSKGDNWDLRDLYVNGVRATRARTIYGQLEAATLSNDLSAFTVTVAPGQLKSHALRNWNTDSGAEILILGQWEITRKRIQSVDARSGVVTLMPPHLIGCPQIRAEPNMWCRFEGAIDMLDKPGEWCADTKTGTISYWPKPGEDMHKAMVYAPRLSRLLEIAGTDSNAVLNVHFRNLNFLHTNWPLPPQGYNGRQGCLYYTRNTGDFPAERVWQPLDQAVSWEFARRCSMENCAVAHTGGNAMTLGRGSSMNVLEGNLIFDVGGTAVTIGEDEPARKYCLNTDYSPATGEVPYSNRVANNRIHDIGVTYLGGVGIWILFTEGNVIEHNLIHDSNYSGMTVGWMWLEIPTVCKNNTIQYNHIYNVMKMLSDGAGIRFVGKQPGSIVRGNQIHDVPISNFARLRDNNGLFFDNAAAGFLVTDNVIYSTEAKAIRFNSSKEEWNTLVHNSIDGIPINLWFKTNKPGLEIQYQGQLLKIKKALDAGQL